MLTIFRPFTRRHQEISDDAAHAGWLRTKRINRENHTQEGTNACMNECITRAYACMNECITRANACMNITRAYFLHTHKYIFIYLNKMLLHELCWLFRQAVAKGLGKPDSYVAIQINDKQVCEGVIKCGVTSAYM